MGPTSRIRMALALAILYPTPALIFCPMSSPVLGLRFLMHGPGFLLGYLVHRTVYFLTNLTILPARIRLIMLLHTHRSLSVLVVSTNPVPLVMFVLPRSRAS